MRCASAHRNYREGVAGRNGPQRWKGRTRERSKRGGNFRKEELYVRRSTDRYVVCC